MAKSENNLTAVLQDTANAIKSKKGTSAKICPRDFADEIASIPTGVTPTGTKKIDKNGTYNVTNFANAEVDVEVLCNSGMCCYETIIPSGSADAYIPTIDNDDVNFSLISFIDGVGPVQMHDISEWVSSIPSDYSYTVEYQAFYAHEFESSDCFCGRVPFNLSTSLAHPITAQMTIDIIGTDEDEEYWRSNLSSTYSGGIKVLTWDEQKVVAQCSWDDVTINVTSES